MYENHWASDGLLNVQSDMGDIRNREPVIVQEKISHGSLSKSCNNNLKAYKKYIICKYSFPKNLLPKCFSKHFHKQE